MPQCGQAVTMVPEVRSMLALRPTCCLDDRRRRAGRVAAAKRIPGCTNNPKREPCLRFE